ncbi:2-succinyl-5-enolpyruvyl-6-hydroxy-3-cyclohexene-1-carboxylic-acid synthase, partial [Lentimicrobium sp. L6]
MISNKPGLELLVQIFIQEGIKDIVISPGSRNAPMMLTFPEYPEFNIHSIIDERSAGFFALGLAQKSRCPVVLNCTSGTALLNYAPAIAEAYYQQIPLIVLSADRPEYLIDQGDGQAIVQQNVYHNFIRKSVQLPEDIQSKKDEEDFQRLVFETIEAGQNPVQGPVHINVPLDEPIYDLKEKEKHALIP